MNNEKTISIAVPTCNRAGYISHFLDALCDSTESLRSNIYINDNGSIDDTKVLVREKMIESSNIRYFHNETMLPPDRSFETALKRADGDYVWLLGDTYVIPIDVFKAVYSAIKEDDYDLIVVNVEARVTDIAEKVYTDINELLSEIGWHMTCLSTLVYSRKLLENANYARYHNTYFLQTGIIFEYLSGVSSIKVKWLQSQSVRNLTVPGQIKKDCGDMVFEVWTKYWLNFILSLPPSYSIDSKLKCVMDHGVKSHLLRSSSLKRIRLSGVLNPDSYKKYSKYFSLTIRSSKWFVKFLAYLPKDIVKYL